MLTVMIISFIIIIVVILLSVVTTSQAYSYKHSVDPIDQNPHVPSNESKEQDENGKNKADLH